MVFGILLFLFIVICFALCLLILIQSDKGGGISGAIGGLSGANNFLGTQDTANVLTKGTYVFGSAFLLLCILMTFFAPGGGGGVKKSELQKWTEKTQAITPMPASTMGFAEEERPASADGAEGGPVVAGEDGNIVEAEPAQP